MTSTCRDHFRYSQPDFNEIRSFCRETEAWLNANGARLVSMVPVTGGMDLTSQAGGTAMTCGFVVVAEKP